ncbi:tripartite tricarboxylate transporter substrate binding protein [Pigmentiphaga sp.]|uniref:Bug family tripartite tricarboxylate transporter substrate binding protein n=1 Tax=Pigmentiphaga sp. TaxID=1977564 RepID=UPI00128C8F90|nr:tripartite tricarboxylate transporter substrate binding protein [Pigmentiphaga sp.]MPS29730.1 tripartite tricarboxylate transporter substrate binding protein [Alcaligenaceae bacterium SAGV5]MPS54904.1 tripartite tricarboxylate transporter substrate binding protein [Alcaligenaceae bacterium SAGV3]MPT59193.1 tripartite tricarboxylate transporter substrate binding protein [Alcaligenaceae bacterium]
MKSLLLRLHGFLAILLYAGTVAAQGYPSKTIRMIVPYPPGGTIDRIARDVGTELQKRLKQPVVVENRSGAAGNIGFEYMARQPADGYTLLFAPASNLTIQTSLFKTLPYDLEKDFVPVSLVALTPQMLLVHPSLPVNTVQELVDYSKSHPGKVNYGVTIGAYSHLAGELLMAKTGADFTAVPYQGPAPAMTDLLGGQMQFIFYEVSTGLQYVQSGKLKALAVAHKTRAPLLPNVPTMAEAGFPAFEVSSWYALMGRSGTPRAIVDQLSAEVRAIVQEPGFKKRYEEQGAFVVGSTPAELAAFIKADAVKWTAVVKQVGIEPN